MNYLINVAVPRSGVNFMEHVEMLKMLECRYVPERKCWVGEFDSDLYSQEIQVIGEFKCTSLSALSREQLLALIDACADFKGAER